MKHVFVRPVRPSDAEAFTKWSAETKDNLFDPDVANFPSTVTVCAFDEDGPIMYVPAQRPFFMEALAINPKASDRQKAAALKAIVQFYVSQAAIQGVGEIYLFCNEESTAEFAKHHVFEEVPYRLFRLKTKELETPKAPSV